MKIEIYYWYSQLDKKPSYGVVCDETSVMSQWLWFHMGQELRGERKKLWLYPYNSTWNETKLIKRYVDGNGTEKYGHWVANTINKHYGRVVIKKHNRKGGRGY